MSIKHMSHDKSGCTANLAKFWLINEQLGYTVNLAGIV